MAKTEKWEQVGAMWDKTKKVEGADVPGFFIVINDVAYWARMNPGAVGKQPDFTISLMPARESTESSK